MAKYVLVDRCPVPKQLAPVLKRCLDRSGATLQSCYRGKDARALLNSVGKHDQQYLYDHQNDPGFNPANPPGRSTHELRSDGVAYAGPVGRRLQWWQVGIDVDDNHVRAFCSEARVLGWLVTVTYPSSPREYHHVNFRKQPRLPFPALRGGSYGPRVRNTSAKLVTLGYLQQSRWRWGPAMTKAVKEFQHAQHLPVDGVAGAHTLSQLTVAARAKRRNHK